MKTQIILAALLILSPFILKAQQSIKTTSQPDSVIEFIPIVVGSDVGYEYTIGGKLRTREDVVIKLMAYAPSDVDYQKSKNSMTWSYISAGAFAVSSYAAIINFANQGRNEVATMGAVNSHSNSGAVVFTGIATAFAASAIINWVQGLKHFRKSIKVYNQRFE
jgi:hypothetical protein